jgi:hypothetical protein
MKLGLIQIIMSDRIRPMYCVGYSESDRLFKSSHGHIGFKSKREAMAVINKIKDVGYPETCKLLGIDCIDLLSFKPESES